MSPGYWHAWARTETRKQWRLLAKVTALAVLLLSLLGWFGCAPQVQQAPQGREIRLEETKGGVIAGIVSNAWGADIDAITLPTHPPTTILLRDSDDPGLRCHEAKHREQIIELGQFEFLRRYLQETARFGYANNRFEVEAREAQAACNGGGP